MFRILCYILYITLPVLLQYFPYITVYYNVTDHAIYTYTYRTFTLDKLKLSKKQSKPSYNINILLLRIIINQRDID